MVAERARLLGCPWTLAEFEKFHQLAIVGWIASKLHGARCWPGWRRVLQPGAVAHQVTSACGTNGVPAHGDGINTEGWDTLHHLAPGAPFSWVSLGWDYCVLDVLDPKGLV
jgi:hypothetical protein